jgi:hypothetical protein
MSSFAEAPLADARAPLEQVFFMTISTIIFSKCLLTRRRALAFRNSIHNINGLDTLTDFSSLNSPNPIPPHTDRTPARLSGHVRS